MALPAYVIREDVRSQVPSKSCACGWSRWRCTSGRPSSRTSRRGRKPCRGCPSGASLGAQAAFFFIRFLSLTSAYVVSCNHGASALPATTLSGGGYSFAKTLDVGPFRGNTRWRGTEGLGLGVLGVLGGLAALASSTRSSPGLRCHIMVKVLGTTCPS